MEGGGKVVNIQGETSQVPLLDAYQEALIEAFNAQVATGKVNREGARIIMGFLTGATIALRVHGHDLWAKRFAHAARRLEQDWTSFEREVRKLHDDLCRQAY